ncbi:T9SS C-terminal target domain-containing protein [bacterium]|nr:MAG: T9SS C-terminal target domain-containing protein [bacterium]
MKYLGTVFAQLLCLCMLTSIASAQLLLTEDFDYPAGDSLKLHDWVMTGSPSSYSYVNPVSVTAPGLEYPGYRGSGVGNAASLAATGQDISRYFTLRASGGNVYAFLMVRVSAARSSGDYFFHLIAGSATSSVFAPKLSVKSGEGRLAFGISKRASANAAVYTGFNYGVDTTHLVVLKYKFNAGSTADDEVSLFVFGLSGLPGSEPPTPTVGPVIEASGADVDSLCLCSLRQGSSANAPTVIVDGIRVATAWEGALPVQISSFAGAAGDAATITLTWTTQSEIDNYGFEVQRSDNAAEQFVTISGLIPGHNTTAEPHTYSFADHSALPGRWFYRLKAISLDQSVSYSGVIQVSNATGVAQEDKPPVRFALLQNYPNPFNPKTVVSSQLPVASDLRIVIYDLLGREVAVLVNERKAAGTYEVSFDASSLASGTYVCRMAAGSFVASRRMMLVK